METMKILVVAGATLALASCASIGDPTEKYGTSIKHNIAAQAIKPDPADKANTYIPADPDRRKLARERYRNDEVEQPNSESTTE